MDVTWLPLVGLLNFSLRFRLRALAVTFAGLALLTPASFGNGEPVLLPFRSVRSLILIDAKMNGRSAALLLDTNANHTIISPKVCDSIPTPAVERTNKGPSIVGNALRLRVDL